MGGRVLGIVAMLRQDFLGGQKERIGRQAFSLGEGWVDGFSQRDNVVDELNVYAGGEQTTESTGGVLRAQGRARGRRGGGSSPSSEYVS